MRTPMKNAAMSIILLLATSVAGMAQITGSIGGSVTDPSGAVVADAEVVLTNTGTGWVRSTTTDTEGGFAFTLLPVGTYRLECQRSGFRKAVRNEINLMIGQALRIPLALEVGSVEDAITVIANPSLANAESAVLSEVIENRRIVELPLNGRLFTQLVELTPGISRGPTGGFRGGLTANLTGPNFTSNGARDTDNYYTVDGVTANDRFFNSLTFSPSIESIQEFRVQSGVYSVENGITAGAQINVVTKNGTNDFHGSAYEFFRNDRLNARNFFDLVDVDGDGRGDKPTYQQNQFGVALGGPVQRDRLFFFGNFEGLRQRVAQSRLLTVPTQRMRQGDFGEFGDGDAATRTDVDIRNPLVPGAPFAPPVFFPGNRIPSTLWDPVARELLNLLPAPNRPGVVSNFAASPAARNRSDQFTVRLDHQYSATNSFYGRFTFSNIRQSSPYGSVIGEGRGSSPLPGYGWDLTMNNRNVAVGHTRVWTPRMVGEFRFGYNKVSGGQRHQNAGNEIAQRLGLKGLFAEGDQRGFPRFTITGVSPFGDDGVTLSRTSEDFQYGYKLSYTSGRHDWRFGAEFVRARFAPTTSNNSRGLYIFGSAGNSSGLGFSDFLLGVPGQGLAGNVDDSSFTGNEYYFYAQDAWKIHPQATLMLGVRYDYQEPMVDESLRVANFDTATRRIVVPSRDGRTAEASAFRTGTLEGGYNSAGARFQIVTSEQAGVHPGLIRPDKNNFAPRISLAWDAGQGLVVRTGYGLYFNRKEQFVLSLLNARPPFGFAGQRLNFAPAPVIAPDGTRTGIANFLDIPPASIILPIDPNLRSGYLQQWTLNVQKEGTWGLIETGYAGSKGSRLFLIDSRNYARPGRGPDSREFFPYIFGMTVWTDFGFSTYHAWQSRLVYRIPGGGQLSANYTLSKSIDNSSAGSSGTNDSDSGGVSNPFNRAPEKGPSAFDARHRFVISGVWDLPVGRHLEGTAGKILSGWQVGFIGSYRSGTPFTVDSTRDFAGIGRANSNRPNLTGDPNSGPRTSQQWFNTSAFTNPVAGEFGNAGRNIVRGDDLAGVDLSVLKETAIRETLKLQFRWEVFNLTNHTNFGTPIRSYLPRDGTAGVSNNVNPDFGRVFNAFDPRVMQFAVKLLF